MSHEALVARVTPAVIWAVSRKLVPRGTSERLRLVVSSIWTSIDLRLLLLLKLSVLWKLLHAWWPMLRRKSGKVFMGLAPSIKRRF